MFSDTLKLGMSESESDESEFESEHIVSENSDSDEDLEGFEKFEEVDEFIMPDNKTIYAKTGYLESDQIKDVLVKIIQNSKIKEEVKFKINVLAKGKELIGCTYIWVSSEKFYQILTGKMFIPKDNANHFENVAVFEYNTDVNIKDIINGLISRAYDYLSSVDDRDVSTNRSNEYTMIETTNKVIVTTKYKEILYIITGKNTDGTVRSESVLECNDDDDPNDWASGDFVIKILPPLVDIPKDIKFLKYLSRVPERYLRKTFEVEKITPVNVPEVEYTPSQIEQIKKLGSKITDFKYKIIFEPPKLKRPDEKEFEFNVLVAFNTPPWITMQMIKSEFIDYVKDKKAKSEYHDKMVTYPHISICKGATNKIYVKFNPEHNDAIFANRMSRQLRIMNGGGRNDLATLYFDFKKKRRENI